MSTPADAPKHPAPTEEEAAAIAAALTLLWPSGEVELTAGPADPRWRFSGRWWNRPVPLARPRPWPS